MDEIAGQTLSSRKTVRRYLMHYQIPLRPPDRLILEPEKFGTRRIAGQLTSNPSELRAINQLKAFRKEGLSYRQIVEEMNRLNVPCRKKGAKWHVKTVFNVLKNWSASAQSLEQHGLTELYRQ